MAKYLLSEDSANWLRNHINKKSLAAAERKTPRNTSQMPMPVVATITRVNEAGVYTVSYPNGIEFNVEPKAFQLNDSLLGDPAYSVGDKILLYPIFVSAVMSSDV